MDKPFPSVFDLSPAEHAELDLKIKRAIQNGDMPSEPPNLFQKMMENEVIRNEPLYPSLNKKAA